MAADSSELARLRQRSQAAEERLETVMASISDAFVTLDSEWLTSTRGRVR